MREKTNDGIKSNSDSQTALSAAIPRVVRRLNPRRDTISVVGDDPGPVVAAAVADGPLGEPIEFARSVASIVPAAPTAALPSVWG